MDIDQEGKVVRGEKSEGGQIILPGDALPGIIHVLPQERRPFFPGQAIPLVMDAEVWLPTIQAIQEKEDDVVGHRGSSRPGRQARARQSLRNGHRLPHPQGAP